MADTCATYTLGSLTINNSTGDTLFLDYEEGEIIGLDGAPIRSQIDPQGQSEGGIVHTKFLGPRIITFSGKVLVRTVGIENKEDYVAAVNAVESAAVSALESILNSPTALQWTPTGAGGAKSIQVTYGTTGGEIQFSGNMIEHKFTFTVVAADPTIS
jgi:hypothetical protein